MRNTKAENTVVVRVIPFPQKIAFKGKAYFSLSLPMLYIYNNIGNGKDERKTILPATIKGQAVKFLKIVFRICFLPKT